MAVNTSDNWVLCFNSEGPDCGSAVVRPTIGYATFWSQTVLGKPVLNSTARSCIPDTRRSVINIYICLWRVYWDMCAGPLQVMTQVWRMSIYLVVEKAVSQPSFLPESLPRWHDEDVDCKATHPHPPSHSFPPTFIPPPPQTLQKQQMQQYA